MMMLTTNSLPERQRVPQGGEETMLNGSGWMLSSAVARRLGIKTDTLKHWRLVGKGPRVWRRTSRTTVHYSISSVIEFEMNWHGRDGGGAGPSSPWREEKDAN